MQAIKTKYIGPTNTRCSRIIASCEAGKITVNWDYSQGETGNHRQACEALRAKLGWTKENNYGGMIGGQHADACFWVFEYDVKTET